MRRYAQDASERTMKVQDVILRAMDGSSPQARRRDHRHLGSEYAALEGAEREVRVRWAFGSAARQASPKGVSLQTGILTCQKQSRETPGSVNNRSNMLLQLYPTLSLFPIILLIRVESCVPAFAYAGIVAESYGATLTTSPALAVCCGPDPVKLGFVPRNAYGSLGRCLLPDKSFRRIRPRAQCWHSHGSKKRGSGLSDWKINQYQTHKDISAGYLSTEKKCLTGMRKRYCLDAWNWRRGLS